MMLSLIISIIYFSLILRTRCSSLSIGGRQYELSATALGVDTKLPAGYAMLSSNSNYALVLQYDGNLVIYSTWNDRALWSTETILIWSTGHYLVYQSDGNLVLYTYTGGNYNEISVVWESGTNNNHEIGHIHFIIQILDDGNFVIVDKSDNFIWESQQDRSYETITFPFPVPEPPCVLLTDTYVRNTKPVTCPNDKVTKAGLCYNKCKSGYSSYTGVDCIEDDCPSGYRDLGLTCEKECEKCDKVCIGVKPFRTCDKVCVPYTCDVTYKKIYTRSPSWPNQCPSDYHALDLGTIDALCYKSCKYGYLDAGVICTCNPDIAISDLKKYTKKFSRHFDIQMSDLLDALSPLSGTSLTKAVMEPYFPDLNLFSSFVDSVVLGNSDSLLRRLLGYDIDKKIIVLEIGGGMAAGASMGIAVGSVVDPNTKKRYFYEKPAMCGGVLTDIEMDISVSLLLFDNIDSVPGDSQVGNFGIDAGDVFGIDALWVQNQMLSKTVAEGFSFSFGLGVSPVEVGWHYCTTPHDHNYSQQMIG